MLRLAFVLFLFASVAFAGPKEVRFYDIGSLTNNIPDQPGDALGMRGDPSTDAGGFSPFSQEELVSFIKQHISPETWGGEGCDVEAVGGGLCVHAPADVQELVSRCLGDLARGIGAQVELRVRRVKVSSELLRRLSPPAGSIVLDDARRKALEEALAAKTEGTFVSEERVVAFPGQRVHVKDATVTSYVSGYESEIATQAAIAKPLPSEVQDGSLVDVRPSLSPDGSTLLIETRIRSASVLSMDKFACDTTGMGYLQLPCVASSSVSTCVAVPTGATLLAGWRSLPAEEREKKLQYECILMTATRVGGAPEAPSKQVAKPVRIIDLGVLCRSIPDFPGPAMSLPRRTAGDSGGASITFAAGPVPGAEANPSDLLTLISKSVAPGTWTADNCLEMTSSGRLLARNSPEAMAQLDAFLQRLTRPILRTVTVEASYLSVSPAAYADLAKDGQPLAGGAFSVTPEQASALLARVQAGQGVRELGSGCVSGLPGQRVSLTSIRSQSYVSDYDVQVATQAKQGYPIIGVATTGFVLDVRAQVQEDGKALVLDLRPALAEQVGPIETLDIESGDIAKLQLPKVRMQETRCDLEVPNDGYAVMGMSTRSGEDGPQQVVLLVHASCAGTK